MKNQERNDTDLLAEKLTKILEYRIICFSRRK